MPKAIRRIGAELLEKAIECLQDCGGGEAIHCARKDIKRTRALLRLVGGELKTKQLRLVTKPVRQTAKYLANPRDAYVKMNTLSKLASHFKGRLKPGALRQLRAQLRRAFQDEMKEFEGKRIARTAERLLRRAAKEIERIDVSGKGWNALGPGLKKTYAKGRRAYALVLEDCSPKNLHEWRKQAKDLWYQATLLRPVWPEQMDAIATELESLGDNLGDDHDLFILRQEIQEQLAKCQRHWPEIETLEGLIAQRHRELRAAAMLIGSRFYAETPSAFCHRLAGYWQIWRREKKPTRRLAQAA